MIDAISRTIVAVTTGFVVGLALYNLVYHYAEVREQVIYIVTGIARNLGVM